MKTSKSAMSLMMKAPKGMAPALATNAAPPPMPSHAAMLKDDVQYAKRNATRNWVEGNISTAKHNQTHARANKVLKGMKVGR